MEKDKSNSLQSFKGGFQIERNGRFYRLTPDEMFRFEHLLIARNGQEILNRYCPKTDEEQDIIETIRDDEKICEKICCDISFAYKNNYPNAEDDVCYQNIEEYKDAHRPSNEPPFTAIDVARHIVNYVNQNGGVISNLKLQKILYFIQGTYLSTAGKLCFPDLIHAWEFGPVIPEVYYEFKRFGSNSIPTIHTIYSSRHEAGLPKCWAYEDKIEGTEDAFVINTVINSIGQYSTTVLGDIIYDHGAWTKARETEDKIICWEDLKDSFDNFDKQKGDSVDTK